VDGFWVREISRACWYRPQEWYRRLHWTSSIAYVRRCWSFGKEEVEGGVVVAFCQIASMFWSRVGTRVEDGDLVAAEEEEAAAAIAALFSTLETAAAVCEGGGGGRVEAAVVRKEERGGGHGWEGSGERSEATEAVAWVISLWQRDISWYSAVARNSLACWSSGCRRMK
jgi:hypothetical protein